jgi:hypothetical protein
VIGLFVLQCLLLTAWFLLWGCVFLAVTFLMLLFFFARDN